MHKAINSQKKYDQTNYTSCGVYSYTRIVQSIGKWRKKKHWNPFTHISRKINNAHRPNFTQCHKISKETPNYKE